MSASGLQLWAAVPASDKKGNKRKQKGDKVDTVTNKKGDKTGDQGRQGEHNDQQEETRR